MKKTIGISLMLAGILLIAYPFYKEWEEAKEVRALENALALIESSEDGEVDLSMIEDLTLSQEALENVLELEIPYIDMNHQVLDQTTDKNLSLALTQIKESQTPGIGNFTIAGHRGYRDGRHFSNLDEVPVGEKAYLHTKNKTYVYEITSSEVIEATDIDVLDDQEDLKELTLITCTISGRQRVAVKGKLIDEIPKDS